MFHDRPEGPTTKTDVNISGKTITVDSVICQDATVHSGTGTGTARGRVRGRVRDVNSRNEVDGPGDTNRSV